MFFPVPRPVRAALTALLPMLCGTTANPAVALEPDAIRAAVAARLPEAISLYRTLLRFPNDAAYPEDILRQVEWMEDAFARRDFEVTRIETPGSPVLLAERRPPGAERTVLVYLQSDGQPVDPSRWFQDDPYEPVLKERGEDGTFRPIPWTNVTDQPPSRWDPDWRVFARSASDSKGPMAQFLSALDILDAAGESPAYTLKVIVDTMEEKGSPHLPALVEAQREALAADFLLIFDGPPHASNRPTVKFGARGIARATLTTYGPRVPQHSGHYGNFAPNPAFHLSRILGSMKDGRGRVTIPGFYDGVELTEEVRAVLAAVPDDEAAIRREMAIARADRIGGNLQESVQYPSLNIRGLRSGWVGEETRTIVPATATAEIDVRLVKESDPEGLLELVREHIRGLGYTVIEHEPTLDERRATPGLVRMEASVSYRAYRSDFDEAPGRMARAGLRHLYGEEPILIRTSGGSIPISPFVDTLDIPAASVPTVNIDNNQHSPNENLRLGSFVEGIAMLVAVLGQEAPATSPTGPSAGPPGSDPAVRPGGDRPRR